MKTFFLFRSNLRILEYYHKYKTLEEFENKCHDYWLLLPLQLLKNDRVDEVVIWRLNPKKKTINDIVFNVNGKQFIQRWVDDLNDCILYPNKPMISFFRGGFPEYDRLTRMHSEHLGLKLYTGTGQRIVPQYGGKYDYCLMEDDRDIKEPNHLPFYKTASSSIFYPDTDRQVVIFFGEDNYNTNSEIYDLIWPANFEQMNYKGQKYFIEQISKSNYLKLLKIVHVGNKPGKGIQLCKNYGVTNIEFKGWVDRPEFNRLANKSKFGIVTSNRKDGCPRVITELLQTATPVIIRNSTRVLNYYNKFLIKFEDNQLERVIKNCMENPKEHRVSLSYLYDISLQTIVDLNYNLWLKKWVKKMR